MKKISIALLLGLCIFSSALVYSHAEQTTNNTQVITASIKKKDTSLLIKELVKRIKNEVEIDDARYPGLIKEVEAYAATCGNPDEAAILHSLIAEMYLSFERRNYWTYSQRTPITGFVPEDINEWTSNLFQAKVSEHFDLSLQPEEVLQQTPIRKFAELLESGKDEQLRPTLYDYLIYRILELTPSEELYSRLIAYKKTMNNPKALLLAELDRIAFRKQNLAYDKSNAPLIAELDSLQKVYEADDFAAEIVIARVNIMSDIRYLREKQEELLVRQEILQRCKQAVEKYAAYDRIGILQNQITLLERAQLRTTMPTVVYPGEEIALTVGSENIRSINIKVYEAHVDPDKLSPSSNFQEEIKEDNKTLVRQTNIMLSETKATQLRDTVLRISGLDKKGIYVFEITDAEEKTKSRHLIYASALLAVPRILNSGGVEILVTDFQSGKPVEKATVYVYEQKQGKAIRTDSVLTDDHGIAKPDLRENIRFFRAVSKSDHTTPLATIYLNRQAFNSTEKSDFISLFTDRGLYRPGQNVFVKGIAFESKDENSRVIPNKSVKVILRDANNNEVTTRDFTTNEFGSFNGEFTLPSQTMNGFFTLSTENSTIHFRVEEYKRPGFRVEFESVKKEVAFGDTVTLKGTAQTFSGVPLQNGVVTYSVRYSPLRFHSPASFVNSDRQVLYGETALNSDGSFQFDFVPEKGATGFDLQYANYTVTATLTDSKGETQETNSRFSVGTSSFMLTSNLKERELKDSLAWRIQATTLNGEPVQTEGDYTIVQLIEELKQAGNERIRKTGDTIARGRFSTGKPLTSVLPGLPSGGYRLILEASDEKGRPVKTEQDVVLFGSKDKRPPVFADTWLLEEDLYCLPGESVHFQFGTSHKKAYVLYELFVEGKNVTRKQIELTDEIRKLSLPFLESYGNGAVASFTFIKEGKLYSKNLRVHKKTPSKTLTIKTESFRDKLLSGSNESWKLKVLDADSIPAIAEVLAGMYDASLDKINPFSWFFSPNPRPYLSAPSFRNNPAYSSKHRYDMEEVGTVEIKDFEYSRFNWNDALLPGYMSYSRSTFAPMSATTMQTKTSGISTGETVFGDLLDYVIREEEEEVAIEVASDNTGGSEAVKNEVAVRHNFNESAFFFPVLRTDKEGRFSIDFTLPESNTTWKLQTLAHTKDMKYGQLTKEVVSSKPLMVQPNMPRFLRQGDEVCIKTLVINTSKEALSGDIRLELFDPMTEQPIANPAKAQQPFSLEGGKQETIEWTVSVPSGKDLAGIRIIADAGTISDGEQHLLPVLSNEILVTESTPFYMLEAGEKEIRTKEDRAAYKPSLKTLEVSSNPIWYAVQALPTLTRPENNSATAWFAAYYSNVLAHAIVTANPRIATILSQWEAAGKEASSLVSNLAKNEELKNILLQETPWVMEAADETEQMNRLNILFDLNRAAAQQEEALLELRRQQREDGGWGWFSGFTADRRTTTSILQGMANLTQLSAIQYEQSEKEMQIKALNFLDSKIKDDHALLLKKKVNLKQVTPSGLQMDYLLMRSCYRDIPEAHDVREAIRFYTNQAEKLWEKLPMHMKAQTAILLHRNGQTEKAKTIMDWFKRTTTVSETQGLFWANNRRNGFSPVSPIETHTLLMTAFDELQISGMDTDRMKQWLLNQKRTQQWETTPATMNAIYALLYKGENWLNTDNKLTVQWGPHSLDTTKGTAGAGYSKITMPANEAENSKTVTLRKEGNTPAWGALYEQYFVSADQVVKQQGDLSIEKKLFVETGSEEGTQLVALKEGQTLRVGDKVTVRLTIRVKQEMTYVHLKDMRAGCFEPASQLSGMGYAGNTHYYKTGRDASDHFYFDRLPEGTYVLEHPVYVVRTGEYTFGPADIQCLYAPEYVSRTDGGRLIIKD